MQYVFLIRSSAGGNKYVTRRNNLHTIFNDILRKNHGLSFIADYDSERVCRWGVFLNSVRPMGSTPFDAFPFWVIFCHITLERSWVIGFCLHFCWMYVATAIIYSEPIDVIDRHVMIFRTTYFRTTPMADVNFTSLVRSLITCHHCVSFTVALVICKLQRILKGFTSLVAQRVLLRRCG